MLTRSNTGMCAICNEHALLVVDKCGRTGLKLCQPCLTRLNRSRKRGGGVRKKQARLPAKFRGANLKPSELVQVIERHGGTFRVSGRTVIPENVPECYEAAMRTSAYLVEAIILDRVWTPERDALLGGTAAWSVCFCRERDYPHVHHDPGPSPTHRLRPGHDVFDVLKGMIVKDRLLNRAWSSH